jgi:hypothetical protein
MPIFEGCTMGGRTVAFEGSLALAIEGEAKAWKKSPEKLIQQALDLLAQERERRLLDKAMKEPGTPWREVKAELLAARQ